ncbi:MAG: DUF4397 domain-containing protein [Anaerolineae bacterium]|nr:DUF4397 domain-containing protein [Anaerolineae bacterium]
MLKSRILGGLLIGWVLLLVWGGWGHNPPSSGAQAPAYLRFISLVPTEQSLSILLNEVEVLRSEQPERFSAWLPVPAGEATLAVYTLPLPLVEEPPVASRTALLEPGARYTAIVVPGSNEEAPTLSIFFTETTLNTTDIARVALFNALPDQPVRLLQGDTVLLAELIPGDAPWVSDQRDRVNVQVVDAAAPENQLADLLAVPLAPGNSYFFALVPQENGDGARVFQHVEAFQSNLRVLHVVAGLPRVDVSTAEGELLLEGLGFGEMSSPLSRAPGPLTLSLELTDQAASATPLIEALAVDLAWQAETVVLLKGSQASGQVSTQVVGALPSDFLDILPENGVIYFVHAISDGPGLDVWRADGSLLLENVTYDAPPAFLSLPAGRYDLRITPTGEPDTPLYTVENTTVRAGNLYFWVAYDDLIFVQRGERPLLQLERCLRPEGCN